MSKYAQLTEDLKEANKKATEAMENVSDSGSANMDSVFLTIPRLPEKKVVEAIENAGLRCSGRTEWIGSGFMITPTGVGQGNTRTVAVEAYGFYMPELDIPYDFTQALYETKVIGNVFEDSEMLKMEVF